jgi:hypothetical protein
LSHYVFDRLLCEKGRVDKLIRLDQLYKAGIKLDKPMQSHAYTVVDDKDFHLRKIIVGSMDVAEDQ